jgi:hypothetical protein
MGLWLKIEGADTVLLDERSILSCDFKTETPDDCNARSTDVVNTIKITGRILTALDGVPVDDTMKIAKWSLVRAESADSYRKLEIKMMLANQVIREIKMENAFVVGYEEHYGDAEGVGTFTLVARQKKDLFVGTTIEGGFGN